MPKTAFPPEYSPSASHHALMDQVEHIHAWKPGMDFEAWRASFRPVLRDLVLGGVPYERPKLEVESLWKREVEGGTIEKIHFLAEPHCRVPAYVCLPANVAPPYRFCICVQGHSSGMHNSIGVDFEDEATPIVVEGDRDFALHCMKRGLAALCIEQRGLRGERIERLVETPPRSCHNESMHALMLGRCMVGERVFDVDRAIDYLATRDDVDMDRIGIMGNSGGGTTTVFSAALLDRIAWAMPSCYFCTFRDSILAVHHCLCNYVPGLYLHAEMAEVLGLFAPAPLVVVTAQQDPIFPIDATRREFERLRSIYAAAGGADRCRLVEGPEGHRFYAEPAWPEMLELIDNL